MVSLYGNNEFSPYTDICHCEEVKYHNESPGCELFLCCICHWNNSRCWCFHRNGFWGYWWLLELRSSIHVINKNRPESNCVYISKIILQDPSHIKIYESMRNLWIYERYMRNLWQPQCCITGQNILKEPRTHEMNCCRFLSAMKHGISTTANGMVIKAY